MRGGSIPMLAWGTLLVLLLIMNWIWTGDAIQVGQFAFAVFVVYAFAVAFFVLHRDSVKRGAPEPTSDPLSVPELSLGAVGFGVAIATILFGFVWAHFLVYFGAGLAVLSLGRVAVEWRSERRSLLAARQGALMRVEPTPEAGGIATPGGRGADGAISDTTGQPGYVARREQTRDTARQQQARDSV